jgi:hypothetical protein
MKRKRNKAVNIRKSLDKQFSSKEREAERGGVYLTL